MFGQSRKQAIWQFYSTLIGPSSLNRALIGRACCRVPLNVWKFTLLRMMLAHNTTVDLTHSVALSCHRHHSHVTVIIITATHHEHLGGDWWHSSSNKAQQIILLVIVLSKAWCHLISPSWSNKNTVAFALSGSGHWYRFCRSINILWQARVNQKAGSEPIVTGMLGFSQRKESQVQQQI